MSDLEKLRSWLKTWKGTKRLQVLNVDYYETEPDNGSIDPSGLVEVSRTEDIVGNVTVENQLNFALYCSFAKSPDDNDVATQNAVWIMELQQWIQEQSIRKQTPVFGDIPDQETIKAQNGTVDSASPEGTALYKVLISINYFKKYEV